MGSKISNCGNTDDINQGLKGRVLWLEGNLMPGPGVSLSEGRPVQREVYIFHPTTRGQVVGEGSLFSSVQSDLVTTVETNDEGYFEVKLEPGKYSVFVKEDGRFFASHMDDQHYSPVTVKKDSVSYLEIRINYKAYY